MCAQFVAKGRARADNGIMIGDTLDEGGRLGEGIILYVMHMHRSRIIQWGAPLPPKVH
jgi:hypothetical protein